MKRHVLCIVLTAMLALGASAAFAGPKVKLETTMGDIVVELDRDKAPQTVKNFLNYVNKKHYDGTIFHRVIGSFMIQGGGFDEKMQQKSTDKPIQNEAANGLANKKYTIAMARTNAPHSATSQFFINVVDNASLNYRSATQGGFGYCVFGKVIRGQDVVDTIKNVPTGRHSGHQDVPLTPVVITRASITE